MSKPDLKILDYVGYQPIQSKLGQIYYMIWERGDGGYGLVLKPSAIECTLTELEMIDTVKQIFSEWPEYTIPKCSHTGKYIWQFGIGKHKLVSNTGPIMLGWKTVPWYKPWFRIENTQHMWDMIQTQKVKTSIAKISRRGLGNTQYGNAIFYKGNSEFDCPVIVSEYNGNYGVFKHPNFEQYGFCLKYE